MTGTFINVATVLAGGTLGTLLGDRIPRRIRDTLLNAIGVFTIIIGIDMALGLDNPLVLLVSLVLGGAIGEVLQLEERVTAAAQRCEAWLAVRTGRAKIGDVTRGLVTASLVFCAGPMTILGSIQDGLTGNYTTLAVKAVLDGVTSVAFASALGVGVPLAAAVVLLVQGSLSLGASLLKPLLTANVVAQISAVGGILIVAIGLGILELKRMRVLNLLPALLLAPVLSLLIAGPR